MRSQKFDIIICEISNAGTEWWKTRTCTHELANSCTIARFEHKECAFNILCTEREKNTRYAMSIWLKKPSIWSLVMGYFWVNFLFLSLLFVAVNILKASQIWVARCCVPRHIMTTKNSLCENCSKLIANENEKCDDTLPTFCSHFYDTNTYTVQNHASDDILWCTHRLIQLIC